jgi:transcriptional regulator with XRE-family HTH domain
MRGDRLKALRENAGHTQDSLAELIGKDTKEIWRWENESKNVRSDTLITLAKALNTSTDYLLGISDNPHPDAQPDSVTPREWQIITALRHGDFKTALRAIANE